MNDEGVRELAMAALKSAVDDRDIKAVLSSDLDFWCDVLLIEPSVFRREFLKLVEKDLDELKERRRKEKKRRV